MKGRFWYVLGGAAVVAIGVVAFLAYGISGTGGTAPGAKLSAWVHRTNLGQQVGALQGDDRKVAGVLARHGDQASVRSACGALVTDAQSANDNLPTPDTRASQLLARYYTAQYNAGQACYRSAPWAGYRARADRLVRQVLARIRVVTGAVVPTTTTTVPGGALTGTGFL